jgi:hypothetical protein
MRHTLVGWSTLDHSTPKTDFQVLLEGGGAIGTESSVQMRRGAAPFLIGVDAIEQAITAANEVKISMNTWKSTDYIAIGTRPLVNVATGATTGTYGPIETSRFVGRPLPLETEADWEITFQSSADVDHAMLLHLAYAPFIPTVGGRRTWRKGAVTAAAFATSGVFGTAVNITDLDPGKLYRVAGLFGTGGIDCGILRLKAPSFMGQTLQVFIPQGTFGGEWFDIDSLILSGQETLSVEASGGAANACEYAICFEEIGNTGVVPSIGDNFNTGYQEPFLESGGIGSGGFGNIQETVQTMGALKTIFSS